MAAMAVEVGQLAAGRHFPEPNAAILAHRGEERAAGTERAARNVSLVARASVLGSCPCRFHRPGPCFPTLQGNPRPSRLKATLRQRGFASFGDCLMNVRAFQSQASTPPFPGTQRGSRW
jgi:hypothetical protein